jgi:putative restriction endonuclease
MALPRKPALIQRFVEAIRLCGWNVLQLTFDHPAKLSVFKAGEDRIPVLLYIWNMTHGGYPRDPNELRIQITGIDHFQGQSGVKTLVLGWSEEDQIFAGFDASKHQTLGKSPSFQIRKEAILSAKQKGFGPQEKGNDEIAIAFRPDFTVAYIQELEKLHQSVSSADVKTLSDIVNSLAEPKIKDIPPGPRKTVMQQVQRRVRDANFRSNIMAVYENRCAISGIQLDLLDSAHIVPVEHDSGTDEIKNGICMSAIHHRAFDDGLIGIRTDFSVVLNERKLGHLKTMRCDGGAELFRSTLRDHLILPRKTEYYPSQDYLVFGQELRGWASRDIRM